MYRIDDPSNISSVPAPTAIRTEGFWTKGNPGLGQAPTVMDQDWFNMLQESLIAVLTAAGIPHSKSDYTKLLQAINVLIGAGGSPSIIPLNNTFTGKDVFTKQTSGTYLAVSFASSLAIDFATSVNFFTTVTANFSLPNPTNAVSGQAGSILLTQDGTGNRQLTSRGTNWGGAVLPILSTAAGAVDLLSYIVLPTGKIASVLNKAVA